MKTPPDKKVVDKLRVEAETLLYELENSSPRISAQPRLKNVLENALSAFRIRRIEGLVSITNLSRGTLRKIRAGRSPQLWTMFLFLGNLIEACRSYGSEPRKKTVAKISEIGWRAVSPSARYEVPRLLELLNDIVRLAEGSNSHNGRHAVLTPHEREQLIAILETALLHLKAPLVHKPFLVLLRSKLSNLAAKAAEKQVELALGAGAAAATAALTAFIRAYL